MSPYRWILACDGSNCARHHQPVYLWRRPNDPRPCPVIGPRSPAAIDEQEPTTQEPHNPADEAPALELWT